MISITLIAGNQDSSVPVAIRVNFSVHSQRNRRRRRTLRRIENKTGVERYQPMIAVSNIHDTNADRTRAISLEPDRDFVSLRSLRT
jgi:hypothetical protein